MGKPEWGTKRICQNCGARFYDLRRDPIVCPTCNTTFDPERQVKPRRGPRLDTAAAVAAVVPAIVDDTEELEDAIGGAPDLDDDTEDAAAIDVEEEADAGADISDVDTAEDDEDLIEDTSELGEDDDDIGEVIEHIDDDLADKG